MADITLNEVTDQLLAVLHEAFEGPPERWSFFTDSGSEAGMFGTLAKLSAADASRATGGSTIAAHAHHVSFSLEASSAWIRGDQTPRNWKESWSVSTVDDVAWARMQSEIRSRYRDMLKAVESDTKSGVMPFVGAVATVAHMAYHLGAIKQKALFITTT
jgi:hypothetical protein